MTKEWCSQASCTQRCGRAGREFPGLVFHLIPRHLYVQLPQFNESEMLSAPVEMLYPQARKIGPHFDVPSPTELLALAPHPPSECQLEAAVTTLAQLRAITSERGENIGELAEMTQHGKLALVLPIDVALSRLIGRSCLILPRVQHDKS